MEVQSEHREEHVNVGYRRRLAIAAEWERWFPLVLSLPTIPLSIVYRAEIASFYASYRTPLVALSYLLVIALVYLGTTVFYSEMYRDFRALGATNTCRKLLEYHLCAVSGSLIAATVTTVAANWGSGLTADLAVAYVVSSTFSTVTAWRSVRLELMLVRAMREREE